MTEELLKIAQFVRETKITDAIPELESDLNLSIGYGQRIGEMVNRAEFAYSMKKAESLNKLNSMEDETEITRRAKLDSWLAEERKIYMDLRNIQTHLKALRMSLMQAIKTRRLEPN